MSIQPYNEENNTVKYYKPSELIGIFNKAQSRQNETSHVVFLRVIYLQKRSNQRNWAYCYDTLRDEDSQEERALLLTLRQSQELSNGKLVTVGGRYCGYGWFTSDTFA